MIVVRFKGLNYLKLRGISDKISLSNEKSNGFILILHLDLLFNGNADQTNGLVLKWLEIVH